jgi:hypothetical protein
MNAYKVEYTHQQGTDGDNVHVAAVSREEALYKAFDAVSDLGHSLHTFGDVWMQDGDNWVKTYDHRTIMASVR